MGVGEQIAELQRRLAEVERENAALREENARLRKELEEWKRGHRERGKRRSSRAEGKRRGTGRPRGRKPGHKGAFRPEPKVDDTVDHPVPERCTCGGCVEDTGETQSTIVQDIPKVQVKNIEHVAHVGRCERCGKRVVEPLPGAVPAGQSIAKVRWVRTRRR